MGICRRHAMRTEGDGMNRGMFSSNTYEWETPTPLFELLDSEFHFDLDVCATKENAKCTKFYTVAEDGLKQEWQGRCWMNPPYGRAIAKWVKKAYESVQETAELVVCLVPSRTDTGWWHDYVIAHADEVRYIRGRLRFGNSNDNAPFPSAIVIFRRKK